MPSSLNGKKEKFYSFSFFIITKCKHKFIKNKKSIKSRVLRVDINFCMPKM